MEMTHLGSGICSQSWRITGAIFCETRPAMIIRSDWRGEGRNTSAPKRAISKRDAPMAIISMAQQANPNVMGQMELLRIQLTTPSRVVMTTPCGCSLPNNNSFMRAASTGLPPVFWKRLTTAPRSTFGFTRWSLMILFYRFSNLDYQRSISRIQDHLAKLLTLFQALMG